MVAPVSLSPDYCATAARRRRPTFKRLRVARAHASPVGQKAPTRLCQKTLAKTGNASRCAAGISEDAQAQETAAAQERLAFRRVGAPRKNDSLDKFATRALNGGPPQKPAHGRHGCSCCATARAGAIGLQSKRYTRGLQ